MGLTWSGNLLQASPSKSLWWIAKAIIVLVGQAVKVSHIHASFWLPLTSAAFSLNSSGIEVFFLSSPLCLVKYSKKRIGLMPNGPR
jgi:hypothetical protein